MPTSTTKSGDVSSLLVWYVVRRRKALQAKTRRDDGSARKDKHQPYMQELTLNTQELTLRKLIDPHVLQKIQDGFAEVTGMAALTTDADGVPVTEGSNFTDFCTKLTRKSAIGCTRCEQCDKKGGLQTRNTGKATSYICHAGLIDFAAPIMLNGQFIGSFIGGQVLTDTPDEEKYRKIAEELDINPDDFVVALRKVKIVPKEKVQTAAEFLHTIADVLSSMAFTGYNTTQINNQLISSIDDTTHVIKNVQKISEQAQKSINEMGRRFEQLAELSSKCLSEVNSCNDIVNVIQENATTTHILGLNASIEASRAKEDGKGFGVIAREVRSLADTSKQSADVIKGRMSVIRDHTQEITDNTMEAKQIVEQCINDIENLKDSVSKLHD